MRKVTVTYEFSENEYKEVKNKLNELYWALEEEKIETARRLLKELEEEIG